MTDPRCSMPVVVAFTVGTYLAAFAMSYAAARYLLERVTR